MEICVDSAADETLLMDVLNSTPVVGEVSVDQWPDSPALRQWLSEHDLPQKAATLTSARAMREALQQVASGEQAAQSLSGFLASASRTPLVQLSGELVWVTRCPDPDVLAVRAVIAFFDLAARRPGRLRPCGNPECRLFLLDTSRSNTAHWCSMATCGNRLKARRHHARTLAATDSRVPSATV
jgi:predicted RNA-binding Zn ribbon-like protein